MITKLIFEKPITKYGIVFHGEYDVILIEITENELLVSIRNIKYRFNNKEVLINYEDRI